jgi:hypothetical protein
MKLTRPNDNLSTPINHDNGLAAPSNCIKVREEVERKNTYTTSYLGFKHLKFHDKPRAPHFI